MRSGTLNALRIFRDAHYGLFDRRTDALFELADALLSAGVVRVGAASAWGEEAQTEGHLAVVARQRRAGPRPTVEGVLPVAYAQLRLAKAIVADRRLPWERPLESYSLTPTRALRSFASLLPLVGRAYCLRAAIALLRCG